MLDITIVLDLFFLLLLLLLWPYLWKDLLTMVTVVSSSALLNPNFLPVSICHHVNWWNNCYLACRAQRSYCEPINSLWPFTSCQLWKTVIIINSRSAYSQRATLTGTISNTCFVSGQCKSSYVPSVELKYYVKSSPNLREMSLFTQYFTKNWISNL